MEIIKRIKKSIVKDGFLGFAFKLLKYLKIRFLRNYIIGNLHYLLYRLLNIPFFGYYMEARQSAEPQFFKLLADKVENKNNPKIIELGSWAGGSAILMAEEMSKQNIAADIICIDPWIPYIDTSINNNVIHMSMEKALKDNKIYNLFNHNINASGFSNMIVSFRGTSDERLLMFDEEQFDIIFIDADHCYSSTIKDINNSAPLVKEGGIICGHDLDIQFNKVDQNNALKNKEYDYILDPKTGKYFHPGVSVAVWEYFQQEVSTISLYWLMRKTANGWEKLS